MAQENPPVSHAAPRPVGMATLGYATPEPTAPEHRPRWVYVVAGLYVLIIATVVVMAMVGAALSDTEVLIWSSATTSVLVACGLVLIITPIRVGQRRPVTRRSILLPIVASGLLAGLLFLGLALALWEGFKGPDHVEGIFALVAAVCVWCVWAVVFWVLSMSRSPESIGAWLNRLLLAGSLLELLIAVPAHVVARRRHDCCAGLYTGFGICVGLAVMLLAFGPSVVFLYYRRWQRIKPPVAEKAVDP